MAVLEAVVAVAVHLGAAARLSPARVGPLGVRAPVAVVALQNQRNFRFEHDFQYMTGSLMPREKL